MAGETIDIAFVNQYQNTIRVLSQQKNSRLEGTTIPPVKMQGEYLYWERLGETEAIDMTTRHMDTPNIEPDHSRRRSSASPKVWACLFDSSDEVRMLVDPKAYYNQIMVYAFNRAKDRTIIAALEGNAYEGKAGATAVALPAAQKISAGATGLTIAKLLTANEMLNEAEVDEEAERYIVCAAAQITDLLNTTEVKSADYNNVRALVDGKVNTFMGFTFIRTQLLTYASSTRYCYAYVKGAIGYGKLTDITTRVGERADKNYAWQVWGKMDVGASRIEDVGVIQIACTET